MKIKLLVFLLLLSISSACAAKVQLPSDGLFAKIETEQGTILAQLEFEKTPLTVMSFVGLAEGRFETPSSDKGKPYFDGLTFHRVEPNFVIQGGDPKGNGTGGPGYQFPNEIDSSLNHDTEGILSMANSGPDTNGSQFFITLAPASFLNGNYSVFGHVVEGIDVVKAIAKDDKIIKVSIVRQGTKAEEFQPSWQQFQELRSQILNKQAAIDQQRSKQNKQVLEQFAKQQWNDISFEDSFKSSNSKSGAEGLHHYIVAPGNGATGEQLGDVQKYRLDYTLWVLSSDGKVQKVDSSFDRGEPIEIAVGQVIQAWNLTMPQMQKGEKRIILVPSNLGYGKQGSPPVIPANSYLLFEMEMLEFIR